MYLNNWTYNRELNKRHLGLRPPVNYINNVGSAKTVNFGNAFQNGDFKNELVKGALFLIIQSFSKIFNCPPKLSSLNQVSTLKN